MDGFDLLAMWYLRLNGYFVMPNFIAHGQPGPRTDVDVLAVRFPHSREYEDDMCPLKIPTARIDVIFAEATKGRCKLNGPWKAAGEGDALGYVLRRVGVFESDDDIQDAAAHLYAHGNCDNRICSVRVVCFGRVRNQKLRYVTQIIWPEVLSFMAGRFRVYRDEKADHQNWDSFGKYLWERLDGNALPSVVEIVDGWKARCPCWPD